MGHRRTGSYRSVAVTTSSTVIIPANAHRRYLSISNPAAHDVSIAFGAAAVLNGDWHFPTGQQPWEFRYEDMGAIICTDIYGIIGTAGGNIAVIEGFEPPEAGSGTVGASSAPFGMS